MRIQAVLCDIEGTTTSLSFAHEVLFPLSYDQMEVFIKQNWNSDLVRPEIQQIKSQIGNADPDQVIKTLRSWIKEDRKEGPLKSIQGKIWKDAFESGKIRGHVYNDVPPGFRKWHDSEIQICIFSSGSIEAQKLLFRYSESGDLSQFISSYFDTTTGPKKESSSYKKIASKLLLPASNILFLSDVQSELDAARTAGMQTTQLLREGVTANFSGHPTVNSFDEIKLSVIPSA
jgi:enolase-phosphatase E1